MSSLNEIFYLQASSDDSAGIFVENTHSNFRSKLPKAIDFDGKWMVALTSIYLPSKMRNITAAMGMIRVARLNTRQEIESEYQVQIPDTRCSSVAELINSLNYNFSHTPLIFKEKNEVIGISGKQTQESVYYRISLTSKLACMLGYSNEEDDDNINAQVDIMFRSYGDDSDSEYMFSKAPSLQYSIPPFGFLYCDIAQASTLGHLSVPILKSIPIELPPMYNTSGSFHEFDVLEYVSVAKNLCRL